nr:hypothetical protein B0A51_00896 [Rachicladosporium sp. CCFEE 5018]
MGYAMKPAFYQELDPLIFEHDTRGAQSPKGNRGEQSAGPSQGNDKDTGYVDEEEAENDEDDRDDEDDEDDEDVESGDEGDSEPEQSTSSAPVQPSSVQRLLGALMDINVYLGKLRIPSIICDEAGGATLRHIETWIAEEIWRTIGCRDIITV